jgi:hypothetical protein
MGCAIFRTADRQGIGFMCGEGVRYEPCRDCPVDSEYYCDFPVSEWKTCDAPLCEAHAYEVAEKIHYCKGHYELWMKFVDSGGIKEKLNQIEFINAKLCGQCADLNFCTQSKKNIDKFAEMAACPDFIQKPDGNILPIKTDRITRLQNRLIREAQNGN